MFSRAAVRVARPAIARVVAKPTVSRCISTTLPKFSDANPPKLFGPGGKAGEIASIYDQATGLERLQLLGDIEGVPVFDDSPLDSSRTGTKKDPIVVPSLDGERLIGCTGSPADSHEILWFALDKDEQSRCTECGSVYAMDFQGVEHHGEHAHH